MSTSDTRPLCPVTHVEEGDGAPPRPVIDLDPHGPEFVRHNYAVYRELRESCPVAWSTAQGGFWLLTGYAAVFDATRDDDTFISSQGTGLREVPDGAGPIPIEIDPPDTVQYRRAATGLLSPKAIAEREPEIRRITNELIDAFIETGTGDLVQDLTTPLPARMILRILGMDESRWPEWVEWIHAIIHGGRDVAGPAQMAVFEQVAAELNRRTESGRPGDDLLGSIMTTPVNGAPMPFLDQVRYIFLALLGGMDTTSGLTGNSLVHIAREPELRRTLIERRDLLPSATEEFLRHDTPTQGLARTLSRDTDFHGQRMRAGEKVMLMWASANRDPAEFERPEAIDVERRRNRHMAFGVGLHRCLGSNLARTMFRVMLDEILNRLPDFEITVEEVPRFADAGNVYAPTSLPVRFTPGPRMSPAA